MISAVKKTSAVIIEDSPDEAALLESMISRYKNVEIKGKAASVDDGVNLILEFRPDLVFLDIELIGGTAFDLLQRLGEKNPKPSLIFTTGFNEYAIQAIRLAALDYLLKPIDPVELDAALDRYFTSVGQPPTREQWNRLIERMHPDQKLKINTISGFSLIHPDDIIYLQAEGNYTDIHYGEGKILTSSMNLGKLEEQLPSGRFFRIHRSVIINLKYLTSVNRSKKRCYLEANGQQFEFCMPVLKIRELERGVG